MKVKDLTVDEGATLVFATAWALFSASIGVLLWAKVGYGWALAWMWVFTLLATLALASRVPTSWQRRNQEQPPVEHDPYAQLSERDAPRNDPATVSE